MAKLCRHQVTLTVLSPLPLRASHLPRQYTRTQIADELSHDVHNLQTPSPSATTTPSPTAAPWPPHWFALLLGGRESLQASSRCSSGRRLFCPNWPSTSALMLCSRSSEAPRGCCCSAAFHVPPGTLSSTGPRSRSPAAAL